MSFTQETFTKLVMSYFGPGENGSRRWRFPLRNSEIQINPNGEEYLGWYFEGATATGVQSYDGFLKYLFPNLPLHHQEIWQKRGFPRSAFNSSDFIAIEFGDGALVRREVRGSDPKEGKVLGETNRGASMWVDPPPQGYRLLAPGEVKEPVREDGLFWNGRWIHTSTIGDYNSLVFAKKEREDEHIKVARYFLGLPKVENGRFCDWGRPDSFLRLYRASYAEAKTLGWAIGERSVGDSYKFYDLYEINDLYQFMQTQMLSKTERAAWDVAGTPSAEDVLGTDSQWRDKFQTALAKELLQEEKEAFDRIESERQKYISDYMSADRELNKSSREENQKMSGLDITKMTVIDAMKDATERNGFRAAAAVIEEVAKRRLGDRYPAWMSDEKYRALTWLAIGSLLTTLLNTGDLGIPHKEKLNSLGQLAIFTSADDGMKALLQEVIPFAVSMWDEIQNTAEVKALLEETDKEPVTEYAHKNGLEVPVGVAS